MPKKKKRWARIPRGTRCDVKSCNKYAVDMHHTIDRRSSHGSPGPGVMAIRNQSQFLQPLCRRHHLTLGHELHEATGKWPVGYGSQSNPYIIY